MDCSVAQCLEVIGEWWTMLIVRDAFHGISRFDDFQEKLGISRSVLRQRLSRLVEHGILKRTPYLQHPVRYDYQLTAKGTDLWPVVSAMRQWGDRYAAPQGPPVRLLHKSCGAVSDINQVCANCNQPVNALNVQLITDPGREDLTVAQSRHQKVV